MSRTIVSKPSPARLVAQNLVRAMALVTVVASCSMPVGSGEMTEDEAAESVDDVTSPLTLRSGCDGHYAIYVYKKNGQPWSVPSYYNGLPIAHSSANWYPIGSFDISKSGTSALEWLARERARSAAKDAIIECGEAHWQNRWSPGLPSECSGTNVHNYPFENIKGALERGAQDHACPHANYGDELTIKLLVYATGIGDCRQHPSNQASYDSYGLSGLVYEPYKNSYLTETYVYRCLPPPRRN